MKRTIILIALTITLIKLALPQSHDDKAINITAGTGYMFSCSRPAYEIMLDYSTGRLSAFIGYLGAVNPKRQDITAVIFKTAYGLPISSQAMFQIGVGYCQHVTCAKDAELSGMGIQFSGYLYYKLRPDSRLSVYSGVTKTRAVTAVTAGLRFTLLPIYTAGGCR